jgi:hypothetical protein
MLPFVFDALHELLEAFLAADIGQVRVAVITEGISAKKLFPPMGRFLSPVEEPIVTPTFDVSMLS